MPSWADGSVMVWMTLYFIAAYAVVVTLIVLLRQQRRLPSRIRQVGLAVLLLLPCVPYIAVAGQTAIFGKSLAPYVMQALIDTGMSDGNLTRLRVFWITSDQTAVYVEEPCTSWPKPHLSDRTGSTLRLKRVLGKWKLVEWNSVWSDCGSAEGNTFPPYPNAKEF